MIDAKQGMTPSEVRKFYRNQLAKFQRIGLGGKTENNVTVTETLINATMCRLQQLQFGRKL
mgnify:CR=1 FL=1|tara:strand:- start:6221 stop:6403 length:183 start_codon:yes stop_codon:yes gene_type:complete